MNDLYTLSTGKTLNVKEAFPLLENDEKVGLLFTGGVESFLVGWMLLQQYGPDNVIFMFIKSSTYSNYKENPVKVVRIQDDFYASVAKVGGKLTYEIGNEDDILGDGENGYAFDRLLVGARETFPTLKYMFAGYSGIHMECMDMLFECGWDKNKLTMSQVYEWFKNPDNSKKYPELEDFVHNMNGQIYFVNEKMGFEHVIDHFRRVFKPLCFMTKAEVVELYMQLGIEQELWKTSSCNMTEFANHCGFCKNCLHRKSAIAKNGLADQTIYDT